MKIGIGLPTTIPGAHPSLTLDWACRADVEPFSCLGIIDRVVYSNYESLIPLAAAAGATKRIRLMTTILLAPLCSTALLAKQAATLDTLSAGRFTLGMGIGGREDDFRVTNAAFHKRGRTFEKQLETKKHIWLGHSWDDKVGAIGPAPASPGSPEILIGGYTPIAVKRIARWANGYISGGQADPTRVAATFKIVEEKWKAEGRSGRPRLIGAVYCALGTDAAARSAPSIRSYYSFMWPHVEDMVKYSPVTRDAIKEVIKRFANIGMDELILWSCIAELEQVDRLAELVG